VDGGGELVEVGDRTLGRRAVEVKLELEVLSLPLRLPGALASARFLELPSALLIVLLHEGTEPSAPPARSDWPLPGVTTPPEDLGEHGELAADPTGTVDLTPSLGTIKGNRPFEGLAALSPPR
jgi:hypothetical protein